MSSRCAGRRRRGFFAWRWAPVLLLLSPALLPAPRGVLQTKETSPPVFVDVTREAGLNFRHVNSATPSKYLIETMGGGVALLDYDRDGWMDVYFVNGARLKHPHPDGEPPDKSAPEFWNRLFRNNRDGTFTDVTERAGVRGHGYGMGVAAGDYDNDGFPDLLVTNYGSAILYRNRGDGTFADVTRQAGLNADGWMTSATFLDYNRDGCLDLFICRYLDWDFKRGSLFCGIETPDGRAYCHPDEFPPVANYLFRNNCDGTFSDASGSSGIGASRGKALGVAVADFDRDGWIDISVANDSFPQFLFRNNGDGTFEEIASTSGAGYTEDGQTFAGMGTDLADLDGDGYPDIVTTALPYQYFAFFRNNRDSTFTYASFVSNLAEATRLLSGWGMKVFDFDNDGGREIFFANSHVMDNIEVTQPQVSYLQPPLLVKYREGKFANISAQSGEVFREVWSARGAAFGDLDNDGDIDVVVASVNGPAYLLRNEGGNRNNWIALELRGSKSNRDGMGAQVRLTAPSGKAQHATASVGGSYLASNDPRVFFGLGKEKLVAEIRIEWPSGTTQVLTEIQPNQFLKVEEPRSEPARQGAPASAAPSR
jgi:hypothetical protein